MLLHVKNYFWKLKYFSKSKLTQRNNIISPPHLNTHLSRLNFCPNQIIRLMVAYSTFYDLSPKIGPQRAYLVRKGRVLIGWPSPMSPSGQDRLLIQAAQGICYQTQLDLGDQRFKFLWSISVWGQLVCLCPLHYVVWEGLKDSNRGLREGTRYWPEEMEFWMRPLPFLCGQAILH